MSGVFTTKPIPAGELKHGELFQDEYRTLYRAVGKEGVEIISHTTKTGVEHKWDLLSEVYRLDFIDLDPAVEMSKQMGGLDPVWTEDPIVVLLYVICRDHLPSGVIEGLMSEMSAGLPVQLTNRYLAYYADNVAERLRHESNNDVVALLEAARP